MADTDWTSFGVGAVVAVVLALLVQALVLVVFVVLPRARELYPKLIKPPQIKKTDKEMQQLRAQDESLKRETARWLNALLLRLWVEGHRADSLNAKVAVVIKEEIVDVKRTPAGIALNYGKVLEVGVGTAAPTFSNIAVQCRQTQDSDLTAFMDLAFTGGLAFVLELELIFGIPVMVMVHVKEISGRFVVHYTEKPITTISFAFLGMPKLDLHVESLILQHRFGAVDWAIRKIANIVVGKTLVLPKFKTKWFMNKPPQPPYPWQVDFDEDRMRNWVPPSKEEQESLDAKAAQEAVRKSGFDLAAWKHKSIVLGGVQPARKESDSSSASLRTVSTDTAPSTLAPRSRDTDTLSVSASLKRRTSTTPTAKPESHTDASLKRAVTTTSAAAAFASKLVAEEGASSSLGTLKKHKGSTTSLEADVFYDSSQ